MDETDDIPAVEFTKLMMARMDREIGQAVSISPLDLDPRDNEWSAGFYVLDPNLRVFEVNVWEAGDLTTEREVIAQVFPEPHRIALQPEVLARYEAKIVDETYHGGTHYTGLVFGSLMSLTEWAYVFQLAERVNIVGTPSLVAPVSVNVAIPGS